MVRVLPRIFQTYAYMPQIGSENRTPCLQHGMTRTTMRASKPVPWVIMRAKRELCLTVVVEPPREERSYRKIIRTLLNRFMLLIPLITSHAHTPVIASPHQERRSTDSSTPDAKDALLPVDGSRCIRDTVLVLSGLTNLRRQTGR